MIREAIGNPGTVAADEAGDHAGCGPSASAMRREIRLIGPRRRPRCLHHDSSKHHAPALPHIDHRGRGQVALLGVLVQRFGGRLEYDAAAMKITNRPELNAYLRTEAREGWRYGESL